MVFPLAAAFVTPALAAAGAALVAVPVVIHLLNRRRFRTVEWAAMRFVFAAQRRNRRRMRFESLLLLLTRCAVVLLAGLALARPLGCAGSALASAAGREAGLHLFVLDNSGSASLETAGGESSVLGDARATAAALIDALGEAGARAAIFSAAAPASDVVGSPSYDLAGAADAVRAVPQSAARTDLAGAIERAVRAAEESPDAAGGVTLHVLTDAATSAVEDDRLAALSRRLADAGATLRLYRPAGPAPSNPAVLSLDTTDPLVRRGFDAVQLVARAANFADSADVAATWSLDGRTIDSATPRLGVEPAPVVAPPSLLDALAADGRPRVAALALTDGGGVPGDDERRAVVEQVRELPVLVVEGVDPTAEPGGRSLLAAALSPGEGGYVAVERISDLELGGRPLDGYRAVVLDAVGGIGDATAAELARFVRGGGALLNFLGESTAADEANRTLLPRGLLPGALVGRAGSAEGGDLYAFDFDPRGVHPYLGAFAGADRSGLDAPAIRQYWQIEPADDANPEVVLPVAGTDGDAGVLVHRLGRGRVVTVATSAADSRWTLLPVLPNYAAFLHELLHRAVGESAGGFGWRTLEAGGRVELPATVAVPAGTTPRLIPGGGGEPVPLRREVSGGTATWASPPLDQPGAYELAVGDLRLPIAVNFPAIESDVRRADDAALRAAFDGVELEIVDLSPQFADGEAVVAALDEDDLPDFGWPLLAAAGLLAAGECLLAAHLGRRRS